MREMAATIEIVSAERVRDELVKLLIGAAPPGRARAALRQRAGDPRLPELPALQLEVDEHHRHKDVYEHSMTVLEQAIDLEGPADGPPESVPGPDLVLRLAALLHDVGKPATRRFEGGGGVSFHHHEVVGAKLVAKRLRALRFDKETTKAVARLVELHLRFHGYGEGQWTDSAVRRYVTDAGPLLRACTASPAPTARPATCARPARLAATYDDLETRIDALLELEELKAVRPELDGNEIAAVLGIRPGPGARAGVQAPARRADGRGAGRQGRRARAAAQPGGRSSPKPVPGCPQGERFFICSDGLSGELETGTAPRAGLPRG